MLRLMIILVLTLGIATAVGACGRKGQPEPPPDADFPRIYPSR